nr:unnamed protein product [Callosobruchus chinensis]
MEQGGESEALFNTKDIKIQQKQSPYKIIRQFCNDSISAHYGAAPSESALNLVWSAVVCIFIVGAAVGSLGGSALAARLGRKGVLVICAALAALAALMFFACKAAGSVEMLVLGRLLAGLSAGNVGELCSTIRWIGWGSVTI